MMDYDLKTASIYNDFSELNDLKRITKNDEQGALKKVAQQFESIFIGMVLKSMRQASQALKSDLMNSDEMDFYEGMFDEQLSVSLSGDGFGIASLLEKQLSKEPHKEAHEHKMVPLKEVEIAKDEQKQLPVIHQEIQKEKPFVKPEVQEKKSEKITFDSPFDFARYLWKETKDAASKIGIKPEVLLAQAGLETGWGKRIITDHEGNLSHNLFNIKADKSSDKNKITVNTLEYQEGLAVKRQDHFKHYESFKESFEDYIHLMTTSPRYEKALSNTSDENAFLQALQHSGYATDPNYAQKIMDIVNSHGFKNIMQKIQ